MKTKLKTNDITWEEVCRQNTGAHFLDSGGAYGRIYDSPLPSKSTWLWGSKSNGENYSGEFYQTISLPHYLNARTTIDQSLTKKLREFGDNLFQSEPYRWNEFTVSEEFLTQNNWKQIGHGDNTCNCENNLDQDFQFSKWVKDNKFIYCIHTHNGCDIRGGYSDAVLCYADDELVWDIHNTSYRITHAKNINSKIKMSYKDFYEIEDQLNDNHYRFMQNIKVLRVTKNKALFVFKDNMFLVTVIQF